MVLKAGETFNYFGKTYTYVGESNNPDYIEVKDANGNGKSIPRDASMRTSLSIFEPDPEVVARYETRAEEYHQQGIEAKERKKNFFSQMNSYLNSWGLNFKHQLDSEQKKLYSEAEHEFYAANMDATAASNRERSTYTDLFIYLT